ncbi:endo-1,4-beta-xylanase [Cohnella fermenti]|uniref:Beta-xylanase n=1 Tax=Cohnella fermenti TaxID=2565925 RepID=A0A4S4BH57_9BACL|nr:endo-1,4-beta-xylanase [Cohnella fermenti]THF73597.1 hypothetical protein E6C55_28350 [Cohnella fermenti]
MRRSIRSWLTGLSAVLLLLPPLMGGAPRFASADPLPTAVVEEDFEAGTLGAAPSGWSLPAAADGYAEIADKIGFPGEKALKLVKNGASSNFTEFRKDMPSRSLPFTVAYDYMLDAGSARELWFDADNTAAFPYALGYELSYAYPGSVKVPIGSMLTTNPLDDLSLVKGAWYAIQLQIDPANKTYDLYIDHQLALDGMSFRNEAKSFLTQLTFWFDATAADSTAYIDDLTIYDGLLPEPEPLPVYEPTDALPTGGADVVAPDDMSPFVLMGDASEDGDSALEAVYGMPFSTALQAQTYTEPPTTFDLQLQAVNSGSIGAGDTIVYRFYVRSLSGDGAQTQALLEKNGTPYTKSLMEGVRVKPDWQLIQFSARSLGDYAPGEANVIFRLGFEPQTIQIGGVQVVNYHQQYKPEQFVQYDVFADKSVPPYEGAEPDADWRADAAARIEQYRKGDLQVTVLDANGDPYPNASVDVEMKRHAFSFGTSVNDDFLSNPSSAADLANYQYYVEQLFNSAVIENNMKGHRYNLPGKAEQVDDALDWLEGEGFALRGHNLIWQEWNWSPPSFEAAKTAPETLRQTVRDYVTAMAGTFAGRVDEWDVINEPLDHHALTDILGMPEMAEWVKAARAADPDALMYVNEYDIGEEPVNYHYWDEKRSTLVQLLEDLADEGAPIDGIGLQGHYKENLLPPEELYEVLEQFADVVPHIKGTEFDVNITDEEVQAQYLHDYMTIMFSHPQVDGILIWGFWDGMHYANNAPIFRRDWSLKPSGEAFMDLVFDQWWTSENGETDACGDYTTRGFLGDYEVTVEAGGETKTVSLVLEAGGTDIVVQLDTATVPDR